MYSINDAFPAFLGIQLDQNRPYISVAMKGDSVLLEATDDGSAPEEKQKIDEVIIKLRKVHANVTQDGPEDQIPHAIFMCAIQKMQAKTSDAKELSQFRIQLADALKQHIEALFFLRPKRQSEPVEITSLRKDFELKLVLTTPAELQELRKRAPSGSEKTMRRPSISKSQAPQLLAPSPSSSSEEAPSLTQARDSTPRKTRAKRTSIGTRQDGLSVRERGNEERLKALTFDELNGYLISWREQKPLKWIEPDLQIEEPLKFPLRRAVCQELLVRLLKDVPTNGRSLAKDIVAILDQITFAQEPLTATGLERFQEIVERLLTKLTSDAAVRDEILKLCVYDKGEEFPYTKFIDQLLEQRDSNPIAKKLIYLLRASIQDCYDIPGQEIRGLFAGYISSGKNKNTPYYPSVEYTLGTNGDVKVVSQMQIGFKKTREADVLFSIIMKNELYTTLETCSEWKSVIVFEVPGEPKDSFVKEQVLIPLLEGGFFATRTQQAPPIGFEIWNDLIDSLEK